MSNSEDKSDQDCHEEAGTQFGLSGLPTHPTVTIETPPMNENLRLILGYHDWYPFKPG